MARHVNLNKKFRLVIKNNHLNENFITQEVIKTK